MKGQTLLSSHAISIALTVVLITVIIISFNSIREDYEDFVIKEEMEQTCQIIKTSIQSIFLPSDYENNGTMSYLNIFLPEKIGELNYRAVFNGNELLIRSMGNNITKKCHMCFTINYTGFTVGGKTKIIWMSGPGEKIKMEVV